MVWKTLARIATSKAKTEQGRQCQRKALLNNLKKRGIDIAELTDWVPTEQETEAIQRAHGMFSQLMDPGFQGNRSEEHTSELQSQ